MILLKNYRFSQIHMKLCFHFVNNNSSLFSMTSLSYTAKKIHKIQNGKNFIILPTVSKIKLVNYQDFHTSLCNFKRLQNFSSNSQSKNNNDNNSGRGPIPWVKIFLWSVGIYIAVNLISLFTTPSTSNHPEIITFISWNEFYHKMLAKGKVEKIFVRPALDVVGIVLKESNSLNRRVYFMKIVDLNKFEDKFREAEATLGLKGDSQIPITYEREDGTFGLTLIMLCVLTILITILPQSKKAMKININIFQISKAKFTLVDPFSGPRRNVKLCDVAGLKEAKVELMEFVDYLRNPERYKSLGAKVPKGALLLGPPGCGKTLLAKAVATDANVPFLSMNGPEFVDVLGGLGAARVRDLFIEANKRSPSIIYIDEIDAIGRQRSTDPINSNFSNTEQEQTLNQLLAEMNGIVSNDGVIVLASTNRAEVLDRALLRPGRFDRHILIDLPTAEERREIFEYHLKSIVLQYPPTNYSSRLSHLTPGFSGADIANVCNEAALLAARSKKSVINGVDLEYAIERFINGPEKKNHSIWPNERRIVAYHESGHAIVGWLLEHSDALLKVTIIPRTSSALGFSQFSKTDRKLYHKDQLFDTMCMALGGRVAEALIFNKITTAAQNDLDKVTKIAYAQIREYGMSNVIGLISFPEYSKESGRIPYSKSLKSLIDFEARKLISKCYYRTEELLKQNDKKLKLLAETLLINETLFYEDIVKLIGDPPHINKKFIKPAEFEMKLKA